MSKANGLIGSAVHISPEALAEKSAVTSNVDEKDLSAYGHLPWRIDSMDSEKLTASASIWRARVSVEVPLDQTTPLNAIDLKAVRDDAERNYDQNALSSLGSIRGAPPPTTNDYGHEPDRKSDSILVTKGEVEMAIASLERNEVSPPNTMAHVLTQMAGMIRQPIWEKDATGKLQPTGGFETGITALETLRDGFGKGAYRRVSYDELYASHRTCFLGPGMENEMDASARTTMAREAEKALARSKIPAAAEKGAGSGR